MLAESQVRQSVKKIALVTGSASGIGANVSIDLVKRGYLVVVTGRDINKLNKVVQQCNCISQEPSAFPFVSDLFEIDQVDKLINFIRARFNRLDLLVNNACWRGYSKDILTDGVIDDMTKVMHINLFIPVYLIQKCLVPMKCPSSSAIVINISSVAGQVPVPLHLYSISKACFSELSKQIANLIDSLGIYSLTISPGPVLTEERPHHAAMGKFTLMNRVGTTQEISNLVTFAIDNARLFNGKDLTIDGGYLAKQKQ